MKNFMQILLGAALGAVAIVVVVLIFVWSHHRTTGYFEQREAVRKYLDTPHP